MGITPLAIAHLFCNSPASRREAQERLSQHLAQAPSVALPPPQAELLAMHAGDREPDPSWIEAASKLQAQFLTVSENSCYGNLSIFSPKVAKPTAEDWKLAEQLCAELIDKGLCHAVVLRQGCESKGFFGKRVSPAIVAAPDSAKLAVLKWFDQLDVLGLPAVVDKLDLAASPERYCENKWQALLAACKADPRFAPAIAYR